MNKPPNLNMALLEGRKFILGREGHIFIDSSTASKHHAQISIIKGKVYLRDLDSTNGTFKLVQNLPVRFHKGFVDLQQPIVIGGIALVIQDLLATASDFAAVDDVTTRVEIADHSHQQAG